MNEELQRRLDEIDATMSGPSRLAARCEALIPWLLQTTLVAHGIISPGSTREYVT